MNDWLLMGAMGLAVAVVALAYHFWQERRWARERAAEEAASKPAE